MVIARFGEENYEIDNSLNIISGITVAFNVVALFLNGFDMYKSKKFKRARIELGRGNIAKGSTFFIKDFLGSVLK